MFKKVLGNQARHTQRLTELKCSSSILDVNTQCIPKTEAKEPLTFSAGGRVAQADKKTVWITRDILTQANRDLEAEQSFLKMVETGRTITVNGRDLVQVAPKWNHHRATTIPETKRLIELNRNDFVSHSDCFMTAQLVMGVEDTAMGANEQTAPIFDFQNERTPILPRKKSDFPGGPGALISGNSPTRGYVAFLEKAIPEFYKYLDNKKTKTVAETSFLADCRRRSINGFLFAVRAMGDIEKYPGVKDAFGQIFKINEYLDPRVGQAVVIFNEPLQVKSTNETAVTQAEQLWNYHFAGVVIKSGDAYVTLENFSVDNDEVDNDQWVLNMCSMGDASFYSQAAAAGGIGNAALTLSFTKSEYI